MGQNKIDLTKDTSYIHPTNKQCNYEPDLSNYATKEELETVKGMIEVSARIVETKGLQVSGSSSNNNATYTVAECDYIILYGKSDESIYSAKSVCYKGGSAYVSALITGGVYNSLVSLSSNGKTLTVKAATNQMELSYICYKYDT